MSEAGIALVCNNIYNVIIHIKWSPLIKNQSCGDALFKLLDPVRRHNGIDRFNPDDPVGVEFLLLSLIGLCEKRTDFC